MPSCLDAALRYLHLGLNVLPLAGKRPRIAWERLQTQRASEQEVERWFAPSSHSGVGIITGPISGVWVLDVDPSHGGNETLAQLEQQYGPLPASPTVRTGSGGRHFYIAWRDDIGNKVNLLPGLDVRGRGGYVVAPPSIHPNGHPYQWLIRPDEIAPALAPAWLLAVLKDATAPRLAQTPTPGPLYSSPLEIERACRYLEKCDPAISGQGGHPQTFKIAVKLVKGFGLDPEDAFQLLSDVYNPKCVPPWSEKELRHKIADAIKADGQLGFLRDATMSTPTTSSVPATANTPGAAAHRLYTEEELLTTEFPPLRWAIPDLIPVGCTVFAGRPKTGKSWLTLALGTAVAHGGLALGSIQVDAGDVLYLCLEDPARRIKQRLHKLRLAQSELPPPTGRIFFAPTWSRASSGGIAAIRTWLTSHPDARLLIVDTLEKFRDPRQTAERNTYAQDYLAISELKAIADEFNLCVIVVTHTRKPANRTEALDDPVDEVMSSTGITGAADTILVLAHKRLAATAKLFLTGRDCEEMERQLRWDPARCVWTLSDLANDPDSDLPADQRVIRKRLREHGQPADATWVRAFLSKDLGTIRRILSRMAEDGLLRRERQGFYSHPDL